MVGLVIAYFCFRRGGPMVLSTPVTGVLGNSGWPRKLAFVIDLFAIIAIAIGLGGSVALGVFQVQEGVSRLLSLDGTAWLTTLVFGALCVAFLVPLTVDLSRGMARMSNIAMGIALVLTVYILLIGPTHQAMNAIIEGMGQYVFKALPLGFTAMTFQDDIIKDWFQDWTLNYMIWWLAWSPFVGVFIARISRGRTIREFLLGVIIAPTVFSIFWFGTFSMQGFAELMAGNERLLEATRDAFDSVTFVILEALPLSTVTARVASSTSALLPDTLLKKYSVPTSVPLV